MRAKSVVMAAGSAHVAAALAFTFFAGAVAAEDQTVVVGIHVSGQGLDLGQAAQAQVLYSRLQHAARAACTRGDRVGLAPVADLYACSEKALADAIRSANAPQLTLVYLATHTLREAAARGINVPVQVATK